MLDEQLWKAKLEKCKQLPQINGFVYTSFMAGPGCGLLTHIQGCLQFFLRITVLEPT